MGGEQATSLGAVQARSFGSAGAATRAAFPEDRALPPAELEAFLARKRYATFATTRPDGRPHAAMILFCVWDGRFWLPSVGGATRLRNLAQQPWAALVVHEGEGADHIVVLAEGPAVVHTDVAAVFTGGLADTWRERIGEVPEWAAALIEVRPTKVLSYGPRGVSGSEQAGRD